MIPKIIHYIWFGNKTYPKKVAQCIQSWKKMLPEYEFKLWNEKTFDISSANQFVKEAFDNKRYAFVADYVRFEVLYKFGGIYLDTDVEMLKPFPDSLLQNNLVLTLDDGGYISGSTIMAEPSNIYIQDCIEHYNNSIFILENGKFNDEVINTHMQNLLLPYSYRIENRFQKIKYKNTNIKLYPDDFFHVRSLLSGKMNLTNNSYCIHWHTVLWISPKYKLINLFRIKILVPLIGGRNYIKIIKNIRKFLSTK